MAAHLPYTLLLLFHLLCISSSAVTFHKPNFNNPNDATLIFEGGAARSDPGIIRLTNAHHHNEFSRLTYADRIPLWDSTTGNLSDFTTGFSFSVSAKSGKKKLPCGISFFLAPFRFPVPTNSAVNPAWDPPFYHVGINNNSIASSVFLPWEIDSDSLSGNQHPITVEINYTASTHNLTVSWMNEVNKNWSSLSYVIDLRQVLPEWVTVGFTATTNENEGNQDLLRWDFSSNLEIAKRPETETRILLLALVAVPLGFAAALKLIAISLSQRRKNRETVEGVSLLSINVEFSKGAGPKWVPYKDLVSATDNFSMKLGEGGFGGVYKGFLKGLDIPAVAVKKFSRRSSQGIQEYITEVKVISRLRHRNLVKLVGWCHERGEFLLVYEFMPNGSLDHHLFGNHHYLQWPERYRVVMGLASALLYLHEEWEQCVVHRDIKAGNVMLDSGFNVKLGDFGLARMVDHELGRASKESDVYSFGVVCLEIATGRRVVDYIEEGLEMGLVEWVWELYGNGNHGVAIDGRLADFDEKELECLIVVGLWCAHPDCSREHQSDKLFRFSSLKHRSHVCRRRGHSLCFMCIGGRLRVVVNVLNLNNLYC
ncbi:L-type lectin-domain containing receptor kinase IX.1 [Linum perenne]